MIFPAMLSERRCMFVALRNVWDQVKSDEAHCAIAAQAMGAAHSFIFVTDTALPNLIS